MSEFNQMRITSNYTSKNNYVLTKRKKIIKCLQMSSPWFPLRNIRQDIKQKAQNTF